MIIELWDMDIEYRVKTDTNAEGKDFVHVCPVNTDPENGICLNRDQCLELARVLTFVANELKEE